MARNNPIRTDNLGRTDAGIYIRVSSEPQALKVSPEIQEMDARRYCEMNGYRIVDVYRDTAAYKVGKKKIEPSGTRLDRPEFQRMLKDARNGRINCMIAWKEDRLYRSFRPMLELIDVLENNKGVRVELVKETFDQSLAPLKAWLAKMELQTKNERWHLGMRGRLMAGKIVGFHCYGYDYHHDTGLYTINEEEANWVYHIWLWYGQGYTNAEIHKGLIDAGAEQKNYHQHKAAWSSNVIKRILQRDYYFTGKKPTTIDGETFLVDVPPIIDEDTYQRARDRLERYKSARTGNSTFEYHTAWLDGLAFCAGDGWRMGLNFTQNVQNFVRDITWYRCVHKHHMHSAAPNCANSVRMDWLDRYVWDKLYNFVQDPVVFEERIAQRIDQLQAQQEDTAQNLDALTARLEGLKEERRRVATMFRRNLIAEEDMTDQLEVVAAEENELLDQIANAGNDFGDELDKVRSLSRLYRDYLAEGLEGLDVEPNDPELFKRWSATVKSIIQAFVKRVEVDDKMRVKIETHIDLLGSLPTDNTKVYSSETLLVTFGNTAPTSRTTFSPPDNSLGFRVL